MYKQIATLLVFISVVLVDSTNFSSQHVTCKMELNWMAYNVNPGMPKYGHMKYRFQYPMVMVALKYHLAAKRAWDKIINADSNAMDAVIEAISWCEILAKNCSSVGYGKNPDEIGEPTLDATLFDGSCVCAGAVGGIRNIKHSIKAAEIVLKKSQNTVFLRDFATQFVSKHGLKEENIYTTKSENQMKIFKENNCQPNYWRNTVPNSFSSCGPYEPLPRNEVSISSARHKKHYDELSHDSMAVIVIDKNGSIAAGTSSCGVSYKMPGRVGMAAIPGSGTFADNSCCACVAIGWGDDMMKFAPASSTCDLIRQGLSPTQAAQRVIARIWSTNNRVQGAIIAVTKKGVFGIACIGIQRPAKYFESSWRMNLGTFPFFVRNSFGARRYWITCNSYPNALKKKVNYKDHYTKTKSRK